MRKIVLAAVSALAISAQAAAAAELTGTPLWTFTHDDGAEIAAHDAARQRVFVIGGHTLDVLDAQTGAKLNTMTVDETLYGGINSVAVHGNLVAMALAAADRTNPGKVLFLNADDLGLLAEIIVGANPDMIVFTKDGRKLLVANEGEPSDDYTIDPEGSVSVIDVASRRERRANFRAFSRTPSKLRQQGVRIFGPNATVAQDLEPEYIAVSDDGKKAWVTLQENNALAILDLSKANPVVTKIVPLGLKKHAKPQNALDVNDRDGIKGNLQSFAKLYGYYLPDGIAFAKIGGKPYLFTANEGDAREYDAFAEEERVGDLNIAPTFPAELSRLTVTTTIGKDKAGVYQALYALGGRSFAVWDVEGKLLHDSGKTIEETLATRFPDLLDDGRSDNKGPEPEGVTVGEVNGVPYLFLALERSSSVMAFDVRKPTKPVFAGLLATAGDISPEGLDFVPAGESGTGKPLLIVANEVSKTTTAFELTAP